MQIQLFSIFLMVGLGFSSISFGGQCGPVGAKDALREQLGKIEFADISEDGAGMSYRYSLLHRPDSLTKLAKIASFYNFDVAQVTGLLKAIESKLINSVFQDRVGSDRLTQSIEILEVALRLSSAMELKDLEADLNTFTSEMKDLYKGCQVVSVYYGGSPGHGRADPVRMTLEVPDILKLMEWRVINHISVSESIARYKDTATKFQKGSLLQLSNMFAIPREIANQVTQQ